HVESVQITMAENFGIQGRGAFYDATGTIRDVVQNHLFQVLANLAMEPPVRTDSESIRDEKVKVLKAIPPLAEGNLARGQFRGYKSERGVAPESRTETFVALRLEVDSWRWQGVPFFIRAGKCLPVTSTEVLVRLRRPPLIYPAHAVTENHIRLRISPEVMDAYENVLGDAMAGDATLFARQDYVEEAWRIVDPVLKSNAPVFEYEPGAWGPIEAAEKIGPPGDWHDPVITTGEALDRSLHAARIEVCR